MSAFLDMGGYAAFVWPAYAVALGALLWLVLSSYRAMRTQEAALAEAEAALGPRRRRRRRDAGAGADDA